MSTLKLNFVGPIDSASLLETYFLDKGMSIERKCVRGRTSGAFLGYGTFGWIKAVIALSLCLVRASQRSEASIAGDRPLLVGSRGTPAASLDYSISKRPQWLFDLFGSDSAGRPTAERVFIRTNSGMKRPGPVCINLNANFLMDQDIVVSIGSTPLERAEMYRLELGLWRQFERKDRGIYRHPPRFSEGDQLDLVR